MALSSLRSWTRGLVDGITARRSIAVRAGLAIALVLATGAACGDVVAGTIASQGCFALLYAAEAPYRRRAKVVAIVGGVLVSSAVLGTLVAGSLAPGVVVGGLYATLVALLAIALRLGPPREFFPVMVYLLVAQWPPAPEAWLERGGLVAAGALVAWLLALAPALGRAPRPEERAASRALHCIADLVEAMGRERWASERHRAVLAVRGAVAAADDAGSAAAVARGMRIERLLEGVMGLEAEGSPPLGAAWAGHLRALAEGVAAPGPASPPLPPLRWASRVQAACTELAAASAADVPGVLPEEAPAAEKRGRWRAPSEWWVLRPPHPRVAVRMGLVVALGLSTGGLGFDRAAWVAVSGAAVLQGAHARVIARRALNRALGTVAGVFLASAVLQVSLSTWWLIASIVVLQCGVELLVTASYGLAVVLITPLVLLLAELGGASDPGSLIGVRLVDTLAGCGVATVAVLLLRSRVPTGRLAGAQAAVLGAVASVLDTAFDEGARSRLPQERRRLQSALLDLRAAGEEVIGDAIWSDPAADARWPVTAMLERVAYLALTFPPELAEGPLDRSALRRSLGAMQDAIAGPPRAPDASTLAEVPPVLPSLPRTTTALRDLHATTALLPSRGTAVQR